MPQDLRKLVVRVFDHNGSVIGTGFVVAQDLVVTCAHVVENAGSGPGKPAFVSLSEELETPVEGRVEASYWRGPDSNGLDVAFIRLAAGTDVLAGRQVARLGKSTVATQNIHELKAFGYPLLTAEYQENAAIGRIVGSINRRGVEVIQFESTAVFPGMSGSPLLDVQTDLIIGMFVEYIDPEAHPEAKSALRYAVPSEALVEICPELYLWSANAVVSPNSARLNRILVGYASEVQEQYRQYWDRYVSRHRPYVSAVNLRPARQSFLIEMPIPTTSPSPEERSDIRPSRGDDTKSNSQDTADSLEPAERKGKMPSYPIRFNSLKSVYDLLTSVLDWTEIVLVAEPGAGKSLSLRYFAAQQAALLTERLVTPIPIYLPLSNYRGQSVRRFIVDVLSSDSSLTSHLDLSDNLDIIIDTHPLVLLFDGFNEISSIRNSEGISRQEQFLSGLSVFLEGTKKNSCTYIITSRQPINSDRYIEAVRLEALDEMGLAECLAIHAPNYATDLLASLASSPALREVVANPFKVKAITDTYRYRMEQGIRDSIPDTPGRLYERLVSTLVEREEQKRSKSGEEWKPFSSWRPHLSNLAHILTEEKTTTIRASDLQSEQLQAVELASQCGLMRLTATDASFVHQQIQEYFAAVWLQQEIQAKGLGSVSLNRFASQESWDQPILLLAGTLSSDLDQLIHEVAKSDPFLAACCVGSRPAKVSPMTRSWLADYLGNRLHLWFDDVPFGKITAALGDMRCHESFVWLQKENMAVMSDDGIKLHLEAVAKIDSPEAVSYVLDQIEDVIKRSRRKDLSPFFKTLARMTAPEALHAIEAALYDVRVWDHALEALTTHRFPNLGTHLRTLLGRRQVKIARVAAQLNVTELIPDLLMYAHNLDVSEALIGLGAGQDIIDGYSDFQRFLSQSRTWVQDFAQFASVDITNVSLPSTTQRYYGAGNVERCLTNWYWLGRYLGEEAAQEYVRLLLHCVEHSTNVVSRFLAVTTLACLRRYEVLPLLEKLNSHPATEENEVSLPKSAIAVDSGRQHDELISRFKVVEAFLQRPPPIGCSNRLPDKFIARFSNALVHFAQAKTTGESNHVHFHLDMLMEIAYSVLRRPVSRDGYGFYDQVAALELLVFADAPDVHDELLRALLESISRCGLPGNHAWVLEQSWRLADMIVAKGKRDPAKREIILSTLAPMVHGPDRLSSTIALNIIARLDGVEQAELWLYLLCDQSWPMAYAVVDALGRMTVPKNVADRLVAMLSSPRADKRFFAVLALGSIGKVIHLEELLTVADDSSEQVRWALVWAIARIRRVIPLTVQFLYRSLRSDFPSVRAEAAKTIGLLNIRELSDEIRILLSDTDLRVVEAAAFTLGEFGDSLSVPKMITILADFSSASKNTNQEYLFNRSEHRLPYVVAQALGKINSDVPASRIDNLLKENDKYRQLRPVVLGELSREAHKPRYQQLKTSYHTEGADVREDRNVPGEHPKFGELSVAELVGIAISASHPFEREQAILAMANCDVDWLGSDDLRDIAYDPSPKVRMAYKTTRCKQQFDPGMYEYNLDFDLGLARESSAERPDSVLYLPNRAGRDEVESPFSTALGLARLFPHHYDTEQLLQILIDKLRARTLEIQGFQTLCDLVPNDKLCEIVDIFCQNPIYYPYNYRYSAYYWCPLARRSAWSIVPHLATILETGGPAAVAEASTCLGIMGVYQASRLLKTTTDRLQSTEKFEWDDLLYSEVAVFMTGFDLGNVTVREIDRLQTLFEQTSQHSSGSFALARDLRYLVANSLLKSDLIEATRMWASLYFREMWDPDRDWMNRGIRRWGATAIRCLFEAASDDSHSLNWSLGQMQSSLLFPERIVGQSSGSANRSLSNQALETLSKVPDEYFLPWLTDPHWGVRSLALHILAGRRSEHLTSQLGHLLRDGESSLILDVFKCEMAGLLPNLSEAIELARTSGMGLYDAGSSSKGRSLAIAVVEAIRSLLNGPEEHQADGAEIAKYYGVSQVTADLQRLVLDGSTDVAVAAIKTLEFAHDASCVGMIIRRLNMADYDADLASAGIEALLTFQALPQIREFVLAEVDSVAIASITVAGLLGDMQAAPAVAFRLTDQSPGVVKTALRTLGALDYQPASQAIMSCLDHHNPEVVEEAIYTCALMGLVDSVPKLRYIGVISNAISELDEHVELIESLDDGLSIEPGDRHARDSREMKESEEHTRLLSQVASLALFVLGDVTKLSLGALTLPEDESAMTASFGNLLCASFVLYPHRWWGGHIFERIPPRLANKLIWMDMYSTGWLSKRVCNTFLALQQWKNNYTQWDYSDNSPYVLRSGTLEQFVQYAIQDIPPRFSAQLSHDSSAKFDYDLGSIIQPNSSIEDIIKAVAEFVDAIVKVIQSQIDSNAVKLDISPVTAFGVVHSESLDEIRQSLSVRDLDGLSLSTLVDQWRATLGLMVDHDRPEWEWNAIHGSSIDTFMLLLFDDPISLLKTEHIKLDRVIGAEELMTLRITARLALAQISLYEWGAEMVEALAVFYFQSLRQSADFPYSIRYRIEFELETPDPAPELMARIESVTRLVEDLKERWSIKILRYPFEAVAALRKQKTKQYAGEA